MIPIIQGVPPVPKNRRLALRHELKMPLRFRVRRVADTSEKVGDSKNISLRGLLLRTTLPLTEGATLDLLMEMPEEVTKVPAALWLCTGHVVRVGAGAQDGELREVAVQFDFYEVSRTGRLHWGMGAGLRGPITPRIEMRGDR
jgi:hypothetical protein